ncbi:MULTISPECIES: transporter [unclassified Leeuwenhoekiella]|uniref:transporter n=1 Tax=unclassified Leeuwenhoekiella TaxID=2615029 RepID=UPI000C6A665F|nr:MULTISPECIES: transporter [unclassified Leeuwenhoekiella]MAW93829.1 phenol meta deg superfamily protein [Leeuwenhoekiella sp.]MBA82236.1 phenol meta deg superfamily protein [Leeuwenhoekiella sp.]|tara:strand:- start:11244 stop:12134 length:891 start_codon:yes stop_codon:yes gene_type:complete
MKVKFSYMTLVLLVFAGLTAQAQYTETLNSNRPGQSQGAFAVGTGVFQAEIGATLGREAHNLLFTETENWGTEFQLRYGAIREQLEFNFSGTYLHENITPTAGNADPYSQSGFPIINAGVKYLLYDPYKNYTEKINVYSYHANRAFKWRTLIPAVSVFSGANYVYRNNNPFLPESQAGFSPKIMAITQHNWGHWVWVNNFIYDQFLTDYPTKAWITTMTHSFNPKLAAFAEVQVIISDIYADDLFRFGAAYLITKDLQVDVNALINFKETPRRRQLGLGVSYRLDFHRNDQLLPNN